MKRASLAAIAAVTVVVALRHVPESRDEELTVPRGPGGLDLAGAALGAITGALVPGVSAGGGAALGAAGGGLLGLGGLRRFDPRL